MNITTTSSSDASRPPPATLAPALLDTIQLARRLREEIYDLREVLHCAVDLLREKERKLDAARRQNDALRRELRSVLKRHTERQDQAA